MHALTGDHLLHNHFCPFFFQRWQMFSLVVDVSDLMKNVKEMTGEYKCLPCITWPVNLSPLRWGRKTSHKCCLFSKYVRMCVYTVYAHAYICMVQHADQVGTLSGALSL